MQGTITVFMSLILILILALILTLVEGARVNTAKVFSKRALSTSLDSILAQYYGPLWEEYHVFGYYKDIKENQNQVENEIKERMQYTLYPNQNLTNGVHKKSLNFYNAEFMELSVVDKVGITDYQGEIFIHQAVEYMKYLELGNGVEFLLDNLSLLEQPKQISYVYEKKQVLEEELVEMDFKILELMQQLDGLKTNKDSIYLTKEGKLSAEEYFVKKIVFQKPSMKNVGVNRKEVFAVTEPYYVNPNEGIEKIVQSLQDGKILSQKLSEVILQRQQVTKELNEQEQLLKKLISEGVNSSGQAKSLAKVQDKIKALSKQKKELADREKQITSEQFKISKEILKIHQKWIQTIEKVRPCIVSAINNVSQLIVKSELASPLLQDYKEILHQQKNKVSAEVFEGLVENLKELEKYVGSGEKHYNFINMKQTLSSNLKVIDETLTIGKEGKLQLENSDFERAIKTYNSIKVKQSAYEIKGLTLDYSSLVIQKTSQDNPVNQMNTLLQKGILGFVIDPDLISELKLTNNNLPSQEESTTDLGKDITSILQSFFKSLSSDDNTKGLGSIFNSLGENFDIGVMMKGGIDLFSEKLLLQEYLKEHFYSFDTGNIKNKNKPSALSYELEYMIAENKTDTDNLSSVISKIVLLRTVMDFATIIGDATKRNEAKLLAVATVGFTGLPILVSVTQAIILLIWSFCEALLDVCALLMGKEIPFIKKTVNLQLPEIFMINRSFLQGKANSMKKEGVINLSYADYLNLLLIIKNKQDLSYHAMDLIQENIKLRYGNNEFLLKNCIFGFEVNVNLKLPRMFTQITYVKGMFSNKENGVIYSVTMSESY